MNRPIANKLPPAERPDLNLGYMRLSDSAPIIIAKELGLYEDYGLNVSLHREVSWANLRDKMIAGSFDACQMLAPMGMATTMGAAGIRAPIISGLCYHLMAMVLLCPLRCGVNCRLIPQRTPMIHYQQHWH